MKRTVNKVPLQTITSLLPGFTKITVEDRKHSKIYCDNAEDTEKWSGFVKDIYYSDVIRYKWMRTEVRGIQHTPEGLIIIISTEFEAY